jgi:hypothetical protein
MNPDRKELLAEGLRQLPMLPSFYLGGGRNGEALDTDEAAVWKRVITYRLARYLQPRTVIETHPGLGLSTELYKHAWPKTVFFQPSAAPSSSVAAIVDVDPFGGPWDSLRETAPFIGDSTIVQVSNGEALAVRRNLRRGQRYPTLYYGRNLPAWVVFEYLPRLEALVGRPVRFFYAFPSTVRAVLSNRPLPQSLWAGCPRWMWWLSRYAIDLR